ncbi:MAG: DUF262 domain-containing protein [Polyangiaceae bacterium]
MRTKGKRRPPIDEDAALLPGEEVRFDTDEGTKLVSHEVLNERYIRGDVRIVTESARYPLTGILEMLEALDPEDPSGKEKRYKLDPEYQRRHRWSKERKSRLIESFLMNIPVPPVFLYERDLARFEVMDGRQRLTALRDFYANKFALEGLEYWPELNGMYYSKPPMLPSKIKDGIDRRYISSIVLLKETARNEEEAARLKKIVFERLNSGGVELSQQESRNAAYDGPLNRLCLDLSENLMFRRMWRIPEHPTPTEDDEGDYEAGADEESAGHEMFKRMDDVELVLRFFAYRQLEAFTGGLNKISSFLDLFLVQGNKFEKKLLKDYRQMFEQTISFLWTMLGVDTFCRLDREGKPQARSRPTKIVYDPLMLVASRYARKVDLTTQAGQSARLRKQLGAMYEDDASLFAGRRTNRSDALRRNERMVEAFGSVFGQER